MGGMKDSFGDDLFDYDKRKAAAESAKQLGMEQVESAADPDWQALMFGFVVQVARKRPRFTSDDVFDLYEESGSTATTHDYRAFGPVMMRCAKAGVCRKADCAPINSRRASLHASPRAVWDSLIFGRQG